MIGRLRGVVATKQMVIVIGIITAGIITTQNLVLIVLTLVKEEMSIFVSEQSHSGKPS